MNNLGEIIEKTLSNDEVKIKCMIDYDESFDDKHKKTVCLAQIINYCILFKSNDGIIDYINSDNKKDFLIRKIASLLNIDKENIKTKFDAIVKFAYTNFFKEGFVFHATNSLYGNQIIENGLSNKNRQEEQKDIKYINEILKKYDKLTPFQFVIHDFSHDYTGIFCNSDPLLITNYCNGPEWFRMFCGEASVYHGIVDYKKEKGFCNKNYDDALECILSLIKYYNLTDNESKEVLDFFNKYWNKFEKTTRMVILIPTKVIFNQEAMRNAMLNSLENYSIDHIFDIISSGKSILYNNFCVNYLTDNNKDLNYFSLEQIMLRKKYDNYIEKSR